MNQSIIFPDLQSWDAENNKVVFPVQLNGNTLFCTVSMQTLSKINDGDEIAETQVLAVFEKYRFDIEELVEQKIHQEIFDEEGHISL